MRKNQLLLLCMFCLGNTGVWAGENPLLLPTPENTVTEPLAGRLKINGVDIHATQFHVNAEEERLRSHFVEACAQLRGSYTENNLRGEHIQGCITPPYSLTSQWHMEGNTAYGTLSSLRMDQRTERDPLPDDLPLPANAEILQDIDSHDHGIHGRVLHIHVNIPASDLRTLLEKALLARQWRGSPAMQGQTSVISMNKDNRHLDMVIGADGVGESRVIVVLDQR
ncbi:hypothetical protein HF670_11330 [Acidithiobacillus thiooxidans]|jgi:hypothetical protein|uniref:hypothetical protein n=1 Tax=Acidithiobacillus TaxID=119977 RepID=UPI00187A0B91|nr:MULTISPECIES: hypothetical protein [Acidithiobacillus]MBE7567945.1 hypothetical protein [Acidithiobacillus sp. HP-11]MBU2751141.1 hypothetical protein [Acidithiobacillus thiooxidans]MBU2793258.1 hypothetical protein [Acidithiobacillus thiooxidans]MBU2840139.1 hypothetical protein [Acidithiobacillus thiooxidans]